MSWSIEFTDEFEVWWNSLTEVEQNDVEASVMLLAEYGPNLGRYTVDSVKGSRHTNLKELRTQSKGNPLRAFFAFDPRRTAILLIGGNKQGEKRFYDRMIPLADDLYDEYLEELKKEGLI